MQYEAFRSAFWSTGTFWVTVAVVLFLVAFGGRIFKGVASALDTRAASIQAALDEAVRLRAEAEAMLREAEERQRQAIETAREIAASAEARAHRLAQDLADEAKLAQARREKVVAERITAAQNAAVKEVREAATSRAVEAVGLLLREGFDAGEDAAAIDRAIASLPAQLRAA